MLNHVPPIARLREDFDFLFRYYNLERNFILVIDCRFSLRYNLYLAALIIANIVCVTFDER